MIKNLNLTLSIIVMLIIVVLTFKYGLGTIFSSHHEATNKGNWDLLKKYSQNEEE